MYFSSLCVDMEMTRVLAASPPSNVKRTERPSRTNTVFMDVIINGSDALAATLATKKALFFHQQWSVVLLWSFALQMFCSEWIICGPCGQWLRWPRAAFVDL